jgi:hypothetical protein
MSGFTTTAPDFLTRTEVWSSQLKDILEEQLLAMQYVRFLTEFPDGDTFTIPSIGQAEVDDYSEDTAVNYRAFDTGEFQFSITEYLSSGTYITKKQMQDMFYMNELVSSFVPKQARAIMERLEADILNLSAHRFVGTGTNETMAPADFAKALYALKQANVPQTDLVAIVHPSVEYTLNTLTNLVNVSDNPRWEGIIADGIATGMKFVKNIYGFDVFTSQFLADANETITLSTTAGKANMFFSAASDVVPFVGAWRQQPEVESEFNKDFQRQETVTTARYGVKLFRPENLVCVLTDTDQV